MSVCSHDHSCRQSFKHDGHINPSAVTPVKLLCGLIASSHEDAVNAQKHLLKCIPGPYSCLGPFDFDFTAYYAAEMGSDLIRMIWVMPGLYSLENLHFAKVLTNSLEKSLCLDCKRRVNLDPGYMTAAKVVLFSTKDYTHRVYVGDNIFAEATLKFKNKNFEPFEYTYADYRLAEVREFLSFHRKEYMTRLKDLRKTGNPFECYDFPSMMT